MENQIPTPTPNIPSTPNQKSILAKQGEPLSKKALSKRTIALIVFLVSAAGLLTYTAVSQKPNKPTDVAPSPEPSVSVAPKVVGHSALSLLPNPLTVSSSSASVDVVVDSGGDKVTAVQIELSFDPAVLTPISVEPGTFFDKPFVLLNNIDQKNGKISYALATALNGQPVIGKGKVAVINFTVNTQSAVKESKIELLPKSLVTAEGVYQSVLVNTSGTTVILK